jgi:hypothetical protein
MILRAPKRSAPKPRGGDSRGILEANFNGLEAWLGCRSFKLRFLCLPIPKKELSPCRPKGPLIRNEGIVSAARLEGQERAS